MESLSIGPDSIASKQQMSLPQKNYESTRRSRAGSALSEMETSSRVSSPASQASSGANGRILDSSSPLLPNAHPLSIGRRHTSTQAFQNSPTPSDSGPNSPSLTATRQPPKYNASTIASTLSRYRHSRNVSLNSINSDPKRPESAASSIGNRSADIQSLPSTSRPGSRQQLHLRSRTHSRAGVSVYSARVPTQILINNLIDQLEKGIALALITKIASTQGIQFLWLIAKTHEYKDIVQYFSAE